MYIIIYSCRVLTLLIKFIWVVIVFQNPVCVDYLKMFRDFGTETTCGFRSPYAELEPNRLFAEFRSNQRFIQIYLMYENLVRNISL